MTKFLEQVLAEVRKLSDEEQDRIAAELMAHLKTSEGDGDLRLSNEQLEGAAQAGRSESKQCGPRGRGGSFSR
jgi:hypothetical protein